MLSAVVPLRSDFLKDSLFHFVDCRSQPLTGHTRRPHTFIILWKCFSISQSAVQPQYLIVAAAGLEPATYLLLRGAISNFTLWPETLYPLSYTAYRFYYRLSMSPKPSQLFCLAASLSLQWHFYSNTFFISSHYAGTFGFHLITLSSALHYYLSVIYVAIIATIAHLVSFTDSEFTSILPAVLTGFDTVSFHSVGFEVYFDAVSIQYTYRLAPWLLYLLSDSSMLSPTYRVCTLHDPRRCGR